MGGALNRLPRTRLNSGVLVGSDLAMSDDESKANPEYVEAVGKIIINWAVLEFVLVTYLSAILKVDGFRARVIWASMPNLRARCTLLRRLADTFVDDAALPEFRKLSKRITKLGANRNLVAHAKAIHNPSPKHITLVQDEPPRTRKLAQISTARCPRQISLLGLYPKLSLLTLLP